MERRPLSEAAITQGGTLQLTRRDMPPGLTPGGRGLREPLRADAGFSLLELMASVTILLVIGGAVFTLINNYQKTSGKIQLKADMYENVRGVAELMAQEIGQAGLVSLPSPSPTLSAAIAGSASAQAATVSSTTSMFVGEQLLVDAGTNEELVTLTALNTATNSITAVFTLNHASGAPLNVLGVFPSGVVPPGTTDGSTATVLNLFGDINADGSLVYVRFTCSPGTVGAPGTLTQSVTTIVPGINTLSASQTLLTTLVANPGGTACFQYTTATAAGYTFVTNVSVTVSVQTTKLDPQTNQYLTMTKAFLNLSPRNVLIGLELANDSTTSRLQPTPANVLAY